MPKQDVVKSITFHNFEEFNRAIVTLETRAGVKDLSFNGRLVKDEKLGKKVLRINANWTEEETI